MRRGTVLALLAPLLVTGGCENAATPASGPPSRLARGDLVRFAPDSQPYSYWSPFRDPALIEIRDQESFAPYLQSMLARGWTVPPVDFSTERVVLVAMGERPSSGYGVVFTGAARQPGAVRLGVREWSPGHDCYNATVMTQPIDLARLPLGEPLTIEVARSLHRCGP